MNSDFFQNKLHPLLRELGFNILEVRDNKTAKAFLYVGAVEVPFLIKYSDDAVEITENEIKLFFAELNIESAKSKGIKGLFVVSNFYTESALSSAEELGISLTTYEELLGSTVNFTDYLNELIATHENSDLNKTYVFQTVRNLNGDYLPVETEFENWIEEKNNNVLFILGESGIGKTSFSRQFSYILARNYVNEPTGIPVPILIELKEYKKSLSLTNLIVFHLFNVHNLQLRSFNVFSRLLQEGRILLILDGLDEYINDPNSYESEIFLQELFSLSSGNAKIVVTSAPDYFLYNPEEATAKKMHTSKNFERFVHKPDYTILNLRPFKNDQIARYVKLKTGIENKSIVKTLTFDKKLKEIARVPVLLDLLMEIDLQKAKNKTDIYDIYIQSWLDNDDWMVHLTNEGKSILAMELAWLLWNTNAHAIHYTQLPESLSHFVKKEFKQKRDNDYLLIDIQATPFMVNNAGLCSFVHDSFMDYFVSKKIVSLIEQGEINFLTGNYISRSIIEFLCESLGVEKVYDFFAAILKTTKNRKQRAQCVVALYNLKGFVNKNPEFFNEEENEIAKDISFREYSLMGIDLSYANITGVDFSGVSLSYAVFQNSSLFNSNLENADLSKSVLEKSDLRESNFVNSNLINADLCFALLDNSDLSGAICVEAKMVEVTMNNADCTDARFLQSNLHAALGIKSKMKRVNFNKADLQNADFSYANFDQAVFHETNLNHTLMHGASFKKVTMNSCYIWGAELKNCNFEQAELSNMDMKNALLLASNFKKAKLTGIDFELADLREADFTEAEFKEVNFASADIRGAIFKDCIFDKYTENTLKNAFDNKKSENTEKPETAKQVKKESNKPSDKKDEKPAKQVKTVSEEIKEFDEKAEEK